MEPAHRHERTQSLAGRNGGGASTARGGGPTRAARLPDATENAAAELRSVHEPRRRAARGLPALPGQPSAGRFRSAGHADSADVAREEESLRETEVPELTRAAAPVDRHARAGRGHPPAPILTLPRKRGLKGGAGQALPRTPGRAKYTLHGSWPRPHWVRLWRRAQIQAPAFVILA